MGRTQKVIISTAVLLTILIAFAMGGLPLPF